MALLHNFGKASVLEINLQKSRLYGVGVPQSEVILMADTLRCNSATLTFFHLGLPVGANMRRIVTWKVVEEKINNKLSAWK